MGVTLYRSAIRLTYRFLFYLMVGRLRHHVCVCNACGD